METRDEEEIQSLDSRNNTLDRMSLSRLQVSTEYIQTELTRFLLA